MSRKPAGQRASTRQVPRPSTLVGQPIKRVDDRKFITGNASYLDDIRLSGALHAVFVRSAEAHARILKIETAEALAQPGVVAVFTGRDLEGHVAPLMGGGGEEGAGAEEWGANKAGVIWNALAIDTVNYAGEAVAVVVAEDVPSAEDGAELVSVEYGTLPAVVDPEGALRPDSPKVHDYLPNNLASHSTKSAGDVAKAFKRADEVIKVKLWNQRLCPAPIEPRGVLAAYDEGNGSLTVYLSTQDPHGAREELAEALSLEPEDVRVIAPDVGGAFGGKAGILPEDPVVAYASIALRRPVKWVETRRENLMTMKQGRGQVQYAELAMSRDGRISGLKVRLIVEGGAYSGGEMAGITLGMVPGVYDIPNYEATADTVLTNRVPIGAYRGAGRPEATYLIERAINIASARLKLDPVKVRQVNYIKKERFPFQTSGGHTYDSGDYQANLQKALKLADYQGLLAERRRAREEGRLVGIGVATWVEVSSFGPFWPQTASISVSEEGRVLVSLGGHSHGQGHSTSIAQVVADELGVGLEDVTVRDGDTAVLPWSSLTAGSRTAALSGSAALLCARKVREKMSLIAAHNLGGKPSSKVVFSRGQVYREDQPSKKLKFSQVAGFAFNPYTIPRGMETTIFEYSSYAPKSNAYPFGNHVALVEVDAETGAVKLLKYVAVDDGARIINPLIVEGQIHGGIVQGISQALLEDVVSDENGQSITTTFADYLIPTADMFPEFVWGTTETPTDSNLLGVKGLGEAGTIAATPTIINAVEDALSRYGATIDRMPASPAYLKSLMKAKP